MHKAIKETDFQLSDQRGVYHGKVRDVYNIGDKYLVMVASDRISAFDVVLPKPIPYKGQVLNLLAAKFLQATKDIVPNWVLDVPDARVTIGHRCQPFPVEMVIRGYLTGHAWREYREGKRTICSVTMPENMKENDPFPEPLLTPTTKAHEDHDEDISKEDILRQGLVSKEDFDQMENYTRSLFKKGTEMAADQGLILVDTKYEFGKKEGRIYLIDEVHTPDSSRYFYKKGYEERQQKGEQQKQLSKEFVREWLMENGFQGKEDQHVPVMTEAFVKTISERYIELYEQITGKAFVKQQTDETAIQDRIEKSLKRLMVQDNR